MPPPNQRVSQGPPQPGHCPISDHLAQTVWCEVQANRNPLGGSHQKCDIKTASKPNTTPQPPTKLLIFLQTAQESQLFPLSFCAILLSAPPRVPWIEMTFVHLFHPPNLGRHPQGCRGLKFISPLVIIVHLSSRHPQGCRGLKFLVGNANCPHTLSAPPRVPWIEICPSTASRTPGRVGTPKGAVD